MSKGTNGSTAVMARRRAKDDNEGLTEEERLWKQLDHFCTPPWAGRAGLEHAKRLWPQARVLREPAAGRGHLARPATDYFPTVLASDVHDYGKGYEVRDWLDDAAWPEEPDCDVIFTNPPFSIGEEFVTRGLKRARLGVALLLRLSFLEAEGRCTIMQGPGAKLTQLAVFSERAPMTLGDWDPGASSATAHAWFFWSKAHEPQPPVWFAPGTRERLWLKDDAQRFGRMLPLPLFPEDPGDVI